MPERQNLTVTLNKSTANMVTGATLQLNATISPADRQYAGITWSTSDRTKATVSSTGLVTAVSPGNVQVIAKATYDNTTAGCNITITNTTQTTSTTPQSSVQDEWSIAPFNTNTVEVGKTLQLRLLNNGTEYTGYKSWSIIGSSIISLSNTGLVTAGNVEGNTKVRCVVNSEGVHSVEKSITVVKPTVVNNGTSPITPPITQGEGGHQGGSNDYNVTLSIDPPGPVNMVVGGHLQINSTISPGDRQFQGVTWKSSNDDIATVNSTGYVTAKAVGSADIQAKANYNNDIAICRVNITSTAVNNPLASNPFSISNPTNNMTVNLRPTTATIKVGASITLDATISPQSREAHAIWSSADPSIATVDESGTVRGVKAGTVTITAKSSVPNGSATCSVTVEALPVVDNTPVKNTMTGNINISPTTLTMNKGEQKRLTANVSIGRDSGGIPENTKWDSTDKTIATVNINGWVTAHNPGTTTITATSSNSSNTAECNVTVNPPTAPVAQTGVLTIYSESDTVNMGSTLQLTLNKDGNYSRLSAWESSHPEIATVSNRGLVTPVSPGTTTITAGELNLRGKTVTKNITVTMGGVGTDNDNLIMTPATSEVTVGQAVGYSIENQNGIKYNNVQWTSSNPQVATITDAGIVNGLMVGHTTISGEVGAGRVTKDINIIDATPDSTTTETTPIEEQPIEEQPTTQTDTTQTTPIDEYPDIIEAYRLYTNLDELNTLETGATPEDYSRYEAIKTKMKSGLYTTKVGDHIYYKYADGTYHKTPENSNVTGITNENANINSYSGDAYQNRLRDIGHAQGSQQDIETLRANLSKKNTDSLVHTENDTISDKITEYNTEIARLTAVIANYNNSLDTEINPSLLNLKSQYELNPDPNLQTQIDTLETRKREYEGQVSDLNAQISKYQQLIFNLKGQQKENVNIYKSNVNRLKFQREDALANTAQQQNTGVNYTKPLSFTQQTTPSINNGKMTYETNKDNRATVLNSTKAVYKWADGTYHYEPETTKSNAPNATTALKALV